MKKILLIILIMRAFLFSNDIDLNDFVQMLSSSLKLTIVVDQKLENDISLYTHTDLDSKTSLKILMKVLEKNELVLVSYDNFYLITRIKKKVINNNISLHSKKLNNISFDLIKPLFNVYKELNYSYIASSKYLFINSTKKQFTTISRAIDLIDIKPNQLKLKITIIDTNLSKLKEYGSELVINKNDNSNFFFNLLAFPFSVNSVLAAGQTNTFNSFVKVLNQNKITKIVSSPTLTIFDNKNISFGSVKNIPYLEGSTTVDDTNTKTTNSYSYKDIGLKIDIIPVIFENYVSLDLKLISESILDNSDTPTTSKSTIEQRVRIEKNKPYILTGVNQTQKYNDIQSTPYLSEIPFLGWLFKSDSDEYINSNLTIVLELIDSNTINTNSIKNIKFPETYKYIGLSEHEKRVNEILGN